MARSRYRASSTRWLAVAVTMLALLAGWDPRARATRMMGYTGWEMRWPPRLDHRSPSRPEVKVVAIYRGRNPHRTILEPVHRQGAPDTLMLVDEWTEDVESGSLVIAVRGHDDSTAVDSLGWRVRVASGAMPGLPVAIVGVQPFLPHADSVVDQAAGWRLLSYGLADWRPGQPEHCCPLHAGLLFTCFDMCGNESKPSDTLWVDSPAP